MKTTPTKRKSPKKSRIPDFKTIEEEAEFWDTHDLTEFEDEWEPVDEDIEFILLREQPKRPMTIRLEEDIVTLLTIEARTQGIGPSTLARMAVLKYLKDCGRGTLLERKPDTRRAKAALARKKAQGAA